MKQLRSLLTGSTLLLTTSAAFAHPGHGLGPLSHALDHAAWNFLGFVAGAVVILLIARLPAKKKSHDNDDER